MERCNKIRKMTAGIFSVLLAFNSVFAGGRMVFAGDFEEEKTAETVIKELEEKGVRGDINGDGVINVMDLLHCIKLFKGSGTSDEDDIYRKDVNGDGALNSGDLVVLMKHILGVSTIWSYNNIPKMDGSTSAIPLEAGFKSEMLGISYSDARKLVSHHKTHESFSMLLSGENDMIFTVPISEDQQKKADEAGVKLNFIPVAKEGFVFVVNRNNPVDSLTSAQIRDIYSGKITNWKEVGGNDEKIVPYQRNNDSGSQNYMTEFMKGYDLMTPPTDHVLGTMGSLMDGLAVYDNAESAIGYSVYSYAAQMYENSSDTKFIAVDGIKPTRETMADGTYPLLSNTFIVYTDKASTETRNFAKWAVSDEGQKAVLACGYVPVCDMEYPDELRPYKAVGTGKEKPAGYTPSRKISDFQVSRGGNLLSGTYDKSELSVDFLADKDFQNKINSDIEEVCRGHENLQMKARMINGYLNICIYQSSEKIYLPNGYSRDVYSFIKNLNYDVRNKTRIEKFSDLFYKDENFVSLVNESVGHDLNTWLPDHMKTDFVGLLGEVGNFSLNEIVLEGSGPYMYETMNTKYTERETILDSMVTGEYFDNNLLLEEGFSSYDSIAEEWEQKLYTGDDGEVHTTVSGSRFHDESEVAARQAVYEKIYEEAKKIRAEKAAKMPDYPAFAAARIIISEPYCYADDYAELNVIHVNFGKIDGPLDVNYIFDPRTGERITLTDIFGKDLKNPDGSDVFHLYNIDIDNGTAVTEFYGENPVQFDSEAVNTDYIILPEKKAVKYDLNEPLKGVALGGTGFSDVNGYASSYILEYGPEKIQWEIEGDWNIIAKNKCKSHGRIWYECWDADDGDYYGWIKEYDLEFN